MLDSWSRTQIRSSNCRFVMATALLFSLASCAGSSYESLDNDRAFSAELQYLSLDRSEVFAAPRNSATVESQEIRRALHRNEQQSGTLSRDATSACVLRLAYLQVRLGDHVAADKLLDSIFTQSPAPRTQALVLAHMLRADIAERQSDPARALVELGAAERLSRDPRDRNEIDRRRHRLTMVAQPPVPKKTTGAKTARAVPGVAWNGKAGSITLLEREQWGSRKEVSARLNRMTRIQRVTIHHTAMLAAGTRAANAAQIRAIQRRHITGNGWGDLGYHFMIGRDGTVFEGRRLRYQGAHAGDPVSNKGNVGVCLLGDYSRGQQKPTPVQLLALQRLTAALCKRYGIAPAGILTHKEVRPGHGTACPGAYLTAVVQNMRNAYRVQLAQRVE